MAQTAMATLTALVLAALFASTLIDAASAGDPRAGIRVAADDGGTPSDGTSQPPEAAQPGAEQDNQSNPDTTTANAEPSKTEVIKPGMNCCTMMPSGGIMCKC
jgi:hypothetical protein